MPDVQPETLGRAVSLMYRASDLDTPLAVDLSNSTYRQRRRTRVAIAASLLAHLALLLLFFLGVGGNAIPEGGGGGDEREAIVVTLAGRIGAGRPQTQRPASQLDVLYRQIRDQQSPLIAATEKRDPSRTSGKDLLDAFDDRRPTKAGEQASGAARIDRGGTGSDLNGSKTDHTDKQAKGPPQNSSGAGGHGPAGGLWGQIKPCWDNSSAAAVPVSLEIVLDHDGKIATPPRIIRPNAAAPDEKRLISEARALAAVAACMPYHGSTSANAKTVFRIDFTPHSTTPSK